MQLRLSAIFTVAVLLVACGGGSDNDVPETGVTNRILLTATGSTTAVPSGTNTDLDFVVTNPGTSTANNVALNVTLGDGLTHAGVECSALGGGATCPSDSLTMSGATLPAGGSVRFRMSVVVAVGASGTIASTARVTATHSQATSQHSAQISIAAYSADVMIIGSTSASDFSSGSSVPYSFTVSNAGPDVARDVVLDSLLSRGQFLTSLSCIASDGAICPVDTGTRIMIPSLPVGERLTSSLTAQLSADVLVSVSNSLRATLLGDPRTNNNIAIVSARTRIPTSMDSPSFVELQSDEQEFIGGGSNYSYSAANAVFEVYETDGTLTFRVRGDVVLTRFRGRISSFLIEVWAETRRIEDFFADAERRANQLSDDDRDRAVERLRRARELIGSNDPLERLMRWRAPDEH